MADRLPDGWMVGWAGGEELENFLHWVMLAAGQLTEEEFRMVGAPAVVWRRYLDEVEVVLDRQRAASAPAVPDAHVPAPASVAGAGGASVSPVAVAVPSPGDAAPAPPPGARRGLG